MPSYRQVADLIRQGIEDGAYQPREPIPSIATLMQGTGLSLNTVRKGIKILVDEGLVYTVQGRGTYVSPGSRAPRQD